jgi:hypothetical protein
MFIYVTDYLHSFAECLHQTGKKAVKVDVTQGRQ